jgi:sulfur-oxidizing protein SoxA
MKAITYLSLALLGAGAFAAPTYADPKADNEFMHEFFKKRFPNVEFAEFSNGVYAFDENAREQWLEIEDFPPYEDAVEHGQTLFETPFANGKSYADCFENGGLSIRQDYPKFDADSGQVVTLELAINECRTANGEEALPYGRGDIAAISAYMATTSAGEIINVVVPSDPKALAAYEAGKKLFYERRGQLNMACATCHVHSAGGQIRADILSPALGHTTHFPAYRFAVEDLVTIQHRYAGCNKQVRAKPFELQSEEYRNLEYYHAHMSNGLPVNGPGSRK